MKEMACIIFIATLSLTNLTHANSDLFTPYVAVPTGSWPEAVAIGDVNGDGLNDVVLSTSYDYDPENDYRIFVFLQNASGELNPPVKYPTNSAYTYRTQSVDIGDVNNDGRADVVVGNSGNNIEVFLQNSSGGLDPGISYPTTNSNSIKIADLNHDGLLDVVGIGWGTDSVDVLLQNINGTLNSPVTYTVTHGGYDEVDVGDVNNDGLTDIIVMSGQSTDPNVGVLIQKTDGTFEGPVYYDLGENVNTQGVAVGDVNGDTLQDIVVTYGGNWPDSKIGLFLQNEFGTLDGAISYASYDCPESVQIADINHDGRKDVIVAHGGWEALGVYLQGSNGKPMSEELYPIPYASHYKPQGLAVGDINGDGARDVAIADYNSGLVVLYNKTEEAISIPATPSGTNVSAPNISDSYETGNASSNFGHSLQYRFDWGDGTESGWLPVGETSASKSWALPGTYNVKAQARCAAHTSTVSGWSLTLSVFIFQPPVVTSLKINGGASSTASKMVTLNNTAKGNPTHYMASELPDFDGAGWLPYSTAPKFTLSVGCGMKTVYLKLKNIFDESSEAHDDIWALGPVVISFTIHAGALSTQIQLVTLNNAAANSPTHYMASDSDTFAGAVWLQYSTAPSFALSSGSGAKTVYFKVKNGFDESPSVYDTISALAPMVTSFKINAAAATTTKGVVTLNNVATNSPTHYKASEDLNFGDASWQTYTTAPKFTLTGGGEKTVYFKVKNSFDESAVMSDTILALAPAVTSFKINAGALSTALSKVTLNIVATNSPTHYMASEDPNFGDTSWQTYSIAPKFALSDGSGTKTIYLKVKNGVEESPLVSDTIEAAGVLPAVTSFKINAGAATTTKGMVTLNNVATNSPTHYMASEDLNFGDASWQTYTTTPKFTLSGGSGVKTVYFKVKNIFGESDVKSDIISALSPAVTSFKINAGALSTALSKVTLSNMATNSPTHYMASEDPNFGDTSWQTYSIAPSFALSSGSGAKTIYLKVKNGVEESPPVSDTIEAAGVLPAVTSLNINAGAVNTAKGMVTLNNVATNSPTHYKASEDLNFGDASWQTYSTAPKFDLSGGSGVKTVYFKVKSIFGESAVKSDTIEALVPLVTSFKINAGATSTANGVVTLNNTVTNSPTHYMASESDTFAGADWQIYSIVPKFTLSEGSGTKTFYFKVKNSFAESGVMSDTILASGIPPVVTSFKINVGAASTVKGTVTLNNTAANFPTYYMASEDPNFLGATWQAYGTGPSFVLSPDSDTKTVYFKLKNGFGESSVVSDTIFLY